MLNYIWAELYKVRYRKGVWILFALLLLLELLALPSLGGANGAAFLETFSITHPVGLFLVLPLSALFCSGIGKDGGVKNELAFGLPRTRIYLGKLISSLIVAFLLLGAVMLFYLIVGLLWVGQGGQGFAWADLIGSWIYLALDLPVWIGALSLMHMLFFLMVGSGAAAIVYIGYLAVGEGTLLILFGASSRLFSVWVGERISTLLLLYPFRVALDGLPPDGRFLLHSWLVGMGWLAATTALGLWNFSRRECR